MLPRRMLERAKRIIFVTTLYLEMVRESEPSTDTLEELNRLFKLAGDSDALMVPALLKGVFWGKRSEVIQQASEKLNAGDINQSCQQILSITPAWMRYGEGSTEMLADTKSVLRTAYSVHAQGGHGSH